MKLSVQQILIAYSAVLSTAFAVVLRPGHGHTATRRLMKSRSTASMLSNQTGLCAW
jgi:hypothetical protein